MRQKHLDTLNKFGVELLDTEYRFGRGDALAYIVRFEGITYRWSVTQVDREVAPWLLSKRTPRRYVHRNKYCIYKMYNAVGDILYIGKTSQLDYRLYAHFVKYREPWKDEVASITIAEFVSEADMHIYEMYLITKLKPVFNRGAACADYPSFELPEVDFETITGWDREPS